MLLIDTKYASLDIAAKVGYHHRLVVYRIWSPGFRGRYRAALRGSEGVLVRFVRKSDSARNGRSMLKPIAWFWLMPACVCLVGCTFCETHYLRAVDPNGDPVNYYKVDVSGFTLFSSSRYLAGYFDEKAVDTYFNEYTQPAGAHFDGTTPASGDQSTQNQTKLSSLYSSLEGKSLVLILSTNSDAIAEGIGTIAKSDEIGAILNGMVTKSRTQEQQKTAADLQFGTSRGNVLGPEGDKMVTALDDGTDQAATQDALTRYAGQLANFIGGGHPSFKTLKDVQTWIDQHKTLAGR